MKILIKALRPFRCLLPAILWATLCCAAASLTRVRYAESVSGFMDSAMNGNIALDVLQCHRRGTETVGAVVMPTGTRGWRGTEVA